MPLQLASTRNIVYVNAPGSADAPETPVVSEQEQLDAMVESEPICVRVATLFRTELQQSLLFVKGKAVSDDFDYYYKQFLLDSVHYYLAHGFVPFRLRKVGDLLVPCVMPKNRISWDEGEPGPDDFAPVVNVQLNGGLMAQNKDKDKNPRVYVYTFETQHVRGLLQPAVKDFVHLQHSRGYQVDYMNLSRESVFMWQRMSMKPGSSDFGKANVNQILSVSDQFRMSMDHAATAEVEQEVDREVQENEKRELDKTLRQRPVLSSYSTSLALPTDMTGHVHTFSPPPVNHEAVQQMFNNAVMDSCNIARHWVQGHVRHDNKRHQGDALPQEQKRRGQGSEDTEDAVKTLLLAYEKMLGYIITFILDPSSKAKLQRQTREAEAGGMDSAFAREKNKTVNVVNLYTRPGVGVEIGRVSTRDSDSLRDMFDSFMATEEDFCAGVYAATGIHVSKRYIELNELQFQAQKKALENAIKGAETVEAAGDAQGGRGKVDGGGGQADESGDKVDAGKDKSAPKQADDKADVQGNGSNKAGGNKGGTSEASKSSQQGKDKEGNEEKGNQAKKQRVH